MKISPLITPVMQGVLAKTRALPKEAASRVNKQTKAKALPVWKEEVSARPATPLQAQVIQATANVTVARANIRLQAARKGKALRGGAKPIELAKGAELGSLGKRNKQFGPRNRKGNVAYPAARRVIPRIASLWAQTVARATYEAFE